MQPYKKLFTYWFSVIIYDHTVEFCDKYISSYKLKEQMNGAARSGKQNIVEGSDNLKTSLKVAIKLTGIAKSSLEELIGDLEDFLRQHKLQQWDKSDTRVVRLRRQSAALVRNLSNLCSPPVSHSETHKLPKRPKFPTQQDTTTLLNQFQLPSSPEPAANYLLTLCHQATFLLDHQVDSLIKKHQLEGGFTEKLYQSRIKYRRNVSPRGTRE